MDFGLISKRKSKNQNFKIKIAYKVRMSYLLQKTATYSNRTTVVRASAL